MLVYYSYKKNLIITTIFSISRTNHNDTFSVHESTKDKILLNVSLKNWFLQCKLIYMLAYDTLNFILMLCIEQPYYWIVWYIVTFSFLSLILFVNASRNITLINLNVHFFLIFCLLIDNCQHADLVTKRVLENLTREDELKIIKLHHTGKERLPDEDPSTLSMAGFSTGTLRHSFNFLSVYKHKVGNETEGTTNQEEWVTVDYIFYRWACSRCIFHNVCNF